MLIYKSGDNSDEEPHDMSGTMNINLLHHTPLGLASKGCRMSHDSFKHSDTYNTNDNIGPKDQELIGRIGVKFKHESILEFLSYVYDVEMSTKTLLAFSRHRVGISLTMRSTRYTTKKNQGKHTTQSTPKTKKYLERIMDIVDEAIGESLSNDEISLLLPQGYVYRGQIQFNMRSLRHFLMLRLPKEAHFQIRGLAEELVLKLPRQHLYLVEDIIENYALPEFKEKFKEFIHDTEKDT